MTRILVIAGIVWLEMVRRKDFYVLFILLGVLLFTLMSVNIFGLGSAVNYIMDAGLLLAWLFSLVLAVNLVGRQLPREEERGTIFSLLAKPVSRAELLLGKWLGAWTAVAGATLAFYILFAVVVRCRCEGIAVGTLLQAWVLHVSALSIVVALSLALSTRLTYSAAATTAFVVLGAAFILVPRIPVFLVREHGLSGTAMLILYYLLPHFEVFDLRQRVVHAWGVVPWTTWCWVLVYGALVTAIFLLLAWLGYRRKYFKRGVVE